MLPRPRGNFGIVTFIPFPVRLRLSFASTLLLAAVAPPAAGQGACAVGGSGPRIEGRATGLEPGYRLYDFNGVDPSSSGAPIASSTSTPGVAYDNAYFGSPAVGILYSSFPNTFPDGAVYNYGGGQAANNAFSILFDQSTRGVAFNFAATAGRTSLSAWRRGPQGGFTQVGLIEVRLPAVSNESRACWWGFNFDDGTLIDRLTVSSEPEPSSPRAFGIDNLQVAQPRTTVPEPATLGLMAVGLAVLGVMRRRRD